VIHRVLPPAHSPISLVALRAGWRALASSAAPALTEARVLVTRWFGSRDVLLTDSGTSALALALRMAVRARPDRPRVALPAWACYDLATAADAADVGVVLYDLDPATLGPDWGSLDRALSAGVAAVVVVHAYGLPVNLAEVAARAGLAGSLVIEDAAQAIGATLGDRRAGATGDLGVLSFGRGKGWTGGGGGALLLNPGAPAELALPARETLEAAGSGLGSVVKLSAQWLLARPSLYAVPAALPFLKLGETIYHPPHSPAPAAGPEAEVLLHTAPLQEPEAERRRRTAGRLLAAVVAAGAGTVPSGWEGGRASWLRLPLLPTAEVLRRTAERTAARLGIMPAYPIPLSRLPGFHRVQPGGAGHPGAEELATRLRTLPTHGALSEADIRRLERWLAVA
jgi:dTDP-4-amino-4,6-dideoxygalactose transaminase